jgi:hypothetical protein
MDSEEHEFVFFAPFAPLRETKRHAKAQSSPGTQPGRPEVYKLQVPA